jgi:hypothetical protein
MGESQGGQDSACVQGDGSKGELQQMGSVAHLKFVRVANE